MNFLKFSLLFGLFSSLNFAEYWKIDPSPVAQDEIQEALILAEPGDTVFLSKGIYQLDHGLSLDVDNVSIIGEGIYETVLDFIKQ